MFKFVHQLQQPQGHAQGHHSFSKCDQLAHPSIELKLKAGQMDILDTCTFL
jgi:hypothetical protein